MTKVSIVVPIYGVEKYIRQCLDSILNQTLKDIEVILIDDGSPDKCGEIVDEYALKDSRIKVIHQVNQGYGVAVNAGLDIAQGDYVGIVEPDDYIEPDMYEKLYNQITKFDADMCKASFYKYNSQAKSKEKENEIWKYEIQNIEDFPTDRAFTIKEYPKLFIFHASVWSNIYKRDFLEKNNIRFNNTKSSSYQDLPFMTEVVCKAEKICVLHDYLYHWRLEENQNSSTSCNGEKLLMMPMQCKNAKNIIKNLGLYEELKEAMYMHFYLANGFFNKIQKQYRYEYFKRLTNLYDELRYDKNFHFKFFENKDQIKFIKTILKNRYIDTVKSRIIKKVVAKNKYERIVFWGASLLLKDFIENNNLEIYNISGIIDKNSDRKGEKYGKYEIFAPEDLNKLKPSVIIISIVHFSAERKKEIREYIRKNYKEKVRIIGI